MEMIGNQENNLMSGYYNNLVSVYSTTKSPNPYSSVVFGKMNTIHPYSCFVMGEDNIVIDNTSTTSKLKKELESSILPMEEESSELVPSPKKPEKIEVEEPITQLVPSPKKPEKIEVEEPVEPVRITPITVAKSTKPVTQKKRTIKKSQIAEAPVVEQSEIITIIYLALLAGIFVALVGAGLLLV